MLGLSGDKQCCRRVRHDRAVLEPCPPFVAVEFWIFLPILSIGAMISSIFHELAISGLIGGV